MMEMFSCQTIVKKTIKTNFFIVYIAILVKCPRVAQLPRDAGEGLR